MMSIKLAFLGEPGIGKTAVVEMLKNGEVSGITATIYDWVEVEVKGPSRQSLKIEIHDVSGLDAYECQQREAIKECHGVVLVYSPENLDSVRQLQKWHELSQWCETKPCVCLAYSRCREGRLDGRPIHTPCALPETPWFEVNYGDQAIGEKFYRIANFVLAKSLTGLGVGGTESLILFHEPESGQTDSDEDTASTIFDIEARGCDCMSDITEFED